MGPVPGLPAGKVVVEKMHFLPQTAPHARVAPDGIVQGGRAAPLPPDNEESGETAPVRGETTMPRQVFLSGLVQKGYWLLVIGYP